MFRKKKGENGEDEATAEMDADDISAPPLSK